MRSDSCLTKESLKDDEAKAQGPLAGGIDELATLSASVWTSSKTWLTLEIRRVQHWTVRRIRARMRRP